MADTLTNTDAKQPRVALILAGVVAMLILTRVLGERAWWAVPALLFVVSLTVGLWIRDRTRPVPVRGVLVLAAIAVAYGVILKLL